MGLARLPLYVKSPWEELLLLASPSACSLSQPIVCNCPRPRVSSPATAIVGQSEAWLGSAATERGSCRLPPCFSVYLPRKRAGKAAPSREARGPGEFMAAQNSLASNRISLRRILITLGPVTHCAPLHPHRLSITLHFRSETTMAASATLIASYKLEKKMFGRHTALKVHV